MQTSHSTGCGKSSCACGNQSVTQPPSAKVPSTPSFKRVNGITLLAPEAGADGVDWRELAHTELLRQEAVALGLLLACTDTTAPTLTESDREVIEGMLEKAVQTPKPTPQECERYFEANKTQFIVDQALHVRHILFAVTPGVNVNALAARAEKALLSLLGKNVPEGQFARLAGELSNCPTSVQGGDLGWIGPKDCAPELANELFLKKESLWTLGVHPRLVHSRFGFHILDVQGQRKGQQKSFGEVRERIAMQLASQSRAKALHQYMSLLVGQAMIEGIELQGADSPLVQ